MVYLKKKWCLISYKPSARGLSQPSHCSRSIQKAIRLDVSRSCPSPPSARAVHLLRGLGRLRNDGQRNPKIRGEDAGVSSRNWISQCTSRAARSSAMARSGSRTTLLTHVERCSASRQPHTSTDDEKRQGEQKQQDEPEHRKGSDTDLCFKEQGEQNQHRALKSKHLGRSERTKRIQKHCRRLRLHHFDGLGATWGISLAHDNALHTSASFSLNAAGLSKAEHLMEPGCIRSHGPQPAVRPAAITGGDAGGGCSMKRPSCWQLHTVVHSYTRFQGQLRDKPLRPVPATES